MVRFCHKFQFNFHILLWRDNFQIYQVYGENPHKVIFIRFFSNLHFQHFGRVIQGEVLPRNTPLLQFRFLVRNKPLCNRLRICLQPICIGQPHPILQRLKCPREAARHPVSAQNIRAEHMPFIPYLSCTTAAAGTLLLPVNARNAVPP